jgi:Amt family ammonium transporter
MTFQMTFAIITPALICGAFADRMKFSALLWFMGLWLLLVYAPIAHSVWHPNGFLFSLGVLDFAGGTVVHINAGIAGLVAALVLGKRRGYGHDNFSPYNLTLAVIGASLLWVGWFGFNAGSAVGASGRAGMAMAVTQIATAAAALAWMFAEWMTRSKPSVLGIISGAVAGLVAITPASGFVFPGGALVIGIVAGAVCFWASTSLKRALKYDDSLDVFGVHAVGGIVGALLTGVFAVGELSASSATPEGYPGLLYGGAGQLLLQVYGVAFTVAYTAIVSFILLKVIDVVLGLRVSDEAERDGLDLALHGETVQ